MDIKLTIKTLVWSLSFASICFACQEQSASKVEAKPVAKKVHVQTPLDKDLQRLTLPEGFSIDYWAKDVTNARAMSLSPNGTLYVGSFKEGNVYALRDTNKDGFCDEKHVIMEGLTRPTGLAFKDGSLYVADISTIYRLDNIEKFLKTPPKAVVVTDKFPSDDHHGWKYIAFGPDGKLYVPVGAPCNVCDKPENPRYASICRMNADGSDIEVVQSGIRNTVGFTWHPTTKELWFTDNGRDWMGDDLPACELNHAPKDGLHFGFPYCHQGDTPDPKYGKGKNCTDYVPPVQKLGAHVAPLGLEFGTSDQFPEKYKNQVFIAEHGSWNRTEKSGYQISMVELDGDRAVSYTPFISGWKEAEGRVWGRPVDIEWMPDGSMLISDDDNDCIYRVRYTE